MIEELIEEHIEEPIRELINDNSTNVANLLLEDGNDVLLEDGIHFVLLE